MCSWLRTCVEYQYTASSFSIVCVGVFMPIGISGMGSRSHDTDLFILVFILFYFDVLLFNGIALTGLAVQCCALIAGISEDVLFC